MSQVLYRDLHGETIAEHFGGTAFGYRLSAEQLADPRSHHEYLIYSPKSAALNWTAFDSDDEMQRFLDAYALTLDHEPAPGDRFYVNLPEHAGEWLDVVLPETDALYNEGTRTWTTVGRDVAGHGHRLEDGAPLDDEFALRGQIVRAMPWMHWGTPDEVPAMTGLAIKAIVNEFRVPRVSLIASTNEMAPFNLIGIEGNYTNGRARIYVLDVGSELIPVASDFYAGVLAAS